MEDEEKLRKVLEKLGYIDEIKQESQAIIAQVAIDYQLPFAALSSGFDVNELIDGILYINSEFFSERELEEFLAGENISAQLKLKWAHFKIATGSITDFYVKRKLEIFVNNTGTKIN